MCNKITKRFNIRLFIRIIFSTLIMNYLPAFGGRKKMTRLFRQQKDESGMIIQQVIAEGNP